MRIFLLLTSALLLINITNSNAQDIEKISSYTNLIEYDTFFEHLKFLSDDDLKGRDTGSEGYAKAADYVANDFQNNNLVPFGDDNTYFQYIPFSEKALIHSSIDVYTATADEKVNAIYGENITLFLGGDINSVNEKHQIVFVGYGNIIPSKNINDYKGIDVKGKTVMIMVGGDKSNGASASDPILKLQHAASQGAAGVILFVKSGVFEGMMFKMIHGFISKPMLSIADTAFGGSMMNFGNVKIGAFVKKDFIKNTFKMKGLSLKKELKKMKKGTFKPIELGSEISYTCESKREIIQCKNVVALIPGTDSVLKNEYVVMGGHLDHVGITEPVKGDSICNGMWDNASGSAAIMTMAKAFNKMEEKPKRSIVFVLYTGEEKGLYGSNYYAIKNEISNGKIVANVNIDMLGGLFEVTDLIPLGYSHSNLSESVDFAANSLGLTVDENKEYENEYLQRSDQFSFLKEGIPAVSVENGLTAVDPKIKGEKYLMKWYKTVYHTPKDDLDQEYSKEAFHTAMKVNFLVTYYIANHMDEIKWNEESWIYNRWVNQPPPEIDKE